MGFPAHRIEMFVFGKISSRCRVEGESERRKAWHCTPAMRRLQIRLTAQHEALR